MNFKNSKKIYVIYTGGTLGMVKTHQGFIPQKGFLQKKIEEVKDFYRDEVPEFFINEYENLIDSANIMPNDWITIAKDILEKYASYDGFVVLHGTDTMAYSGAALSFFLKNIDKPVIFTGSQIPMSELCSDAIDNVLQSLILAANSEIKEVCIFFNKKLFRANRTVKVNAIDLDSFCSPNYHLLAKIGVNTHLYREYLWSPSSEGVASVNDIHFFDTLPEIATINIFPGIDITAIERLLQPPLKVVIIKTYGMGNILNQPRLIACIEHSAKLGIIMINASQCLTGMVTMQTYQSASCLVNAGVISAMDMTDEAIIGKLFYLFNQHSSNTTIKSLFHYNFSGELSLQY